MDRQVKALNSKYNGGFEEQRKVSVFTARGWQSDQVANGGSGGSTQRGRQGDYSSHGRSGHGESVSRGYERSNRWQWHDTRDNFSTYDGSSDGSSRPSSSYSHPSSGYSHQSSGYYEPSGSYYHPSGDHNQPSNDYSDPVGVHTQLYGNYAHQFTGYGQQYPTTTQQAYQTGHLDQAYSQQNYAAMDYSQYGNSGYPNSQYNYQQPSSYDAYAQQQQYQPTAPQIRNPFAPPPPARPQYGANNASFDPEYEAQVAQWQSAYAPQDQFDRGKKGGKNDRLENANLVPVGVKQGPAPVGAESVDSKAKNDDKKKTVVRQGGGESWEDESLLEWDPTQFRIYVGNLAGEVTDDSLAKAFGNYGVAKARVVRDKRTTKSKGFGFVAFTDNDLGFRAAKEMRGKYIGSHPVTIERATTNVKPTVQKNKNQGKYGKNKGKGDKKQDDPLRANTGAHIEKKPVKNPAGMKMLG